jgi:hypothetical protein
MTEPVRRDGITSRLLDLVVEEKGLYFIAEWVLRRFDRRTVNAALDDAISRSKLVAKAEAARRADAERRG